MAGSKILETGGMDLRRFTQEDVDHLFELDNDPEVMRHEVNRI
jgi:hypothetical protein